MNKYQYSTNTIYYQQARVFRRTTDQAIAYCLEPFRFFDGTQNYTPTVNPRNLSRAQIDRISKISHFGLGYKKHNTMKWYAVTQMMIWQTADTSGDYYFTDGLNGPRINLFQEEMQEINNLIREHEKLPSFNNKSYTMIEGNTLVVEDTNNSISSFKNDNNLNINGNKVIFSNLKEGEYNYTFTKQDNYYNKPLIFYQSSNSQNLVNTGDINDIKANLRVKVIHTKIELNKVDKDTKGTTPQGEGSLDGAIYKLYDSNNSLIHTFTIEDNQAQLDNLNFGKYYLIEDSPGKGYTVDTNKYEINITEDNPKVQLVLENKIIEKKIIIEKQYGENDSFKPEVGISFDILNNLNEVVKTVTTDENGNIELSLPYGKYKVIQKNSSEGYSKADSFIIDVNNSQGEKILLKDHKIPTPTTYKKITRIAVPNTHIDNSLLILLLQILLIIL